MSAGGKAESVLHDNGISVPFFRNFPFKREVRGKKGCSRGGVARYFSLQFVKFVPVNHVAMIIRYYQRFLRYLLFKTREEIPVSI